VPVPWHERLKAHAGRGFEWHGEGPGIGSVGAGEIFIRLIASFKTTAADIDELVRVTSAYPSIGGFAIYR
jgi:hypothetical protein